jgi:four helix bundle protein
MAGDLGDLLAWKEAAALAADVVSASRQIRGVGALAAADQLCRCAESIPANIAEGYGRGFGRDGSRFLRIARGSAAELESHLSVARGTRRLPEQTVDDLTRRVRRVRALIQGLSRYFESHH